MSNAAAHIDAGIGKALNAIVTAPGAALDAARMVGSGDAAKGADAPHPFAGMIAGHDLAGLKGALFGGNFSNGITGQLSLAAAGQTVQRTDVLAL